MSESTSEPISKVKLTTETHPEPNIGSDLASKASSIPKSSINEVPGTSKVVEDLG